MKIKFSLAFFLTIFLLYIITPYFLKIEIKKIPESQIIYDVNNIEIWEIIAEKKYRHRYKKIDYFPDFLIQSLLTIEDKRFYKHSWIDYISILRALKNNFYKNKIQWASTIDSQLIRNNYWINKKRTLSLKIKEFFQARALNKNYNKNEILELYLNNINLWFLNFWFESASIFYYGKTLKNLTKAEIIWLITIIKNSNLYNSLNNPINFYNRFKILTNSLFINWIITENEKKMILWEKLSFQKNIIQNDLPYIKDFILKTKKNNWWHIYTKIDFYLTKEIEKIWNSILYELGWKNVWDYWVIIIDKNDMSLKTMIWWNDYFSKNWQVNSTLALRQPWSSLKPFIYLLAFEKFKYNLESIILDLPVSYKTSQWNIYSPKNYSLDYKWEITIAEALSQSINIPAVKILEEIWVDYFINFLKKIWINSINKDSDFYWLSIWLWSWEVSLYELTRAFWLFINNWNYCKIKILNTDKQECKKIINEKYTDMINDILTNRYFKIQWFPINSSLDFENRNVFVKTWTSRNFKDNWAVWYTKNYIIWVWVWNKDWSEMQWVSWASWAWWIFNQIVYLLDKYNYNPEIVNLKKEKNKYLKIINPTHNSIFKYDLSIPSEYQKIKLAYYTNYENYIKKWFLNWVEIKNNFIKIEDLKKDSNSLIIELYIKNNLIWKDESVIYLD